ncbi:hypothetical protein [Streptomyces sp. NPDC057545]|uniref:hypothetical protein n=1 Tax=Streptomyces sp. NPDC057545 TaxID=3346164 RepID=UPI0036B5DE4D
MFARVRATAGRVATVAGSVILFGALGSDSFIVPGAIAAVTTAGLGLATNLKLLKAPSSVRATVIAVYAAPHVGCGMILGAEALAPEGTVSLLVQSAVVAVWTGATWYLRPGRLAREAVDEAVAQEIAAAAEDETEEEGEVVEVVPAPTYDSPQAQWWGENFAVEGGIAPGTELLDHQQVDERCLALVIGSVQRGTPVPEISKDRVSAFLDLPVELIEIGPVPGRGAGVRLLVLGERPQPADEAETDEMTADQAMWAEIATEAMPGVELLEVNTYEMRKELT